MRDIKLLLKEAREAIKNKEYDKSLRLCKTILKEDKSNYMAMVFLGLSMQEVGPQNQAEKAFKKAIELDGNNVLAWTGLVNYYEKLDTKTEDTKRELTKAYMSVLSLETNEKKLVEISEKVVSSGSDADRIDICQSLYTLAKSGKLNAENSSEILRCLQGFIGKMKDIPTELEPVYVEILSLLIGNKNTITIEYYSAYLSILYKQNKYTEVFEQAKKMQEIFESNTVPLLWICTVFNITYVEDIELSEELSRTIGGYCSKLLEIDPKNSTGLFTASVLLYLENKVLESKENLIRVTNDRPGLIHAWVLLTAVYLKLRLTEDATYAVTKADKLLKSVSYSNDVLSKKVNSLILSILSNSKQPEDWMKAVEIYKKLDDNELLDKCRLYVLQAYINLEQFSEAELHLQKIKTDKNAELFKLYSAKLLHKQNQPHEALNILEKEESTVENTDWWMELGMLYWSVQEYRKCLVPFLKAAKSDLYNFLIFLHLGHLYQKLDDVDKARRCYEKAIRINLNCSEAGTELSKIYRIQKKWDANLVLLENLTAAAINSKNCWAWLQLGLHYLEQKNHEKAIDNLRLVIRIQPENVHCWESLADAYFERGAYTSALKSYQRVLELSENALYPSLQVANIKKILGEYEDARKDFETILLSNKHYILALKGLAETCVHQARKCWAEQRLGTARNHAQYGLEKISQAIQQRSELSCLWKLLADCCFFTAKLPEKYGCLLVPKAVIEKNCDDGNVVMEKNDLFSFAIKCYCKAVTLLEHDNILIWHDLAVCYLHYGLHAVDSDSDKAEQLFLYAKAAAQHCISHMPQNWQHWNLLGNVAMSQTKPNFALAQHAFIKAVTVEPSCAVAWCNLGILYLLHDDIRLANAAFAQGQSSDPNYVNSWIGQALIAETMGHEDAMDLFRHSTQLAPHQQSALGYGNFVCQTLLDAEPDDVIYAISDMHAVPVACDALVWYTEKDPYNPCAWNMLGILQERLGLKLGAAESFRNACRLSDRAHKDLARVNYGRLLGTLGKNKEAVKVFKEVDEATFNSGKGLALALFKDQQYEESYGAYEAALHRLTQHEGSQSDLLVALASMAYKFQGPDAAKILLFQSIQLKPPSSWGLYATLSLGLLHNDIKLASLVLNELQHLKDERACLKHYAVLLSYFYMFKGEHNKAIREVSKLVHRHPNNPHIWLVLSVLLIRLNSCRKLSKAAENCAKIAMKMGQNNMDVTKVFCLVAVGSLLAADWKTALISAQKAVHCYPDVAEGWAVLFSVLPKVQETCASFRSGIVEYIKRLRPTSELVQWTTKATC